MVSMKLYMDVRALCGKMKDLVSGWDAEIQMLWSFAPKVSSKPLFILQQMKFSVRISSVNVSKFAVTNLENWDLQYCLWFKFEKRSQWIFWYCNDIGVTSPSISPWHCWHIINVTHAMSIAISNWHQDLQIGQIRL